MNIPEDYQQVMPYIIIKDATAFTAFIKEVFGATEKYKVMRNEHTIAHAELQIGDSMIMYADATDQFGPCTAGMFVYVANADETYTKALANGATSIMPPADMGYSRSCGIIDPFGNTWWPTTAPNVKIGL